MPKKIKPLVYMTVCAMHGFMFGILYAPVQALLFGLSFKGTIAWIVSGLPFDFIHGISNFFCGMLIMPIVSILRKLESNAVR
jgi:energy-coupling factor transport system substrate-specific component